MAMKKVVPAAKGEMGKPSLKGKFEAAMQKQWKSRPENQAKAAPTPSLKKPVSLPMTAKAKASNMKIK
jgi:hypothetical protein